MLFLLDFEKNFDFVTQDSLIAKQVLDRVEEHNYKILSVEDFYNSETGQLLSKKDFPENYMAAIPIGSIQFVSAFLKIFYDIDEEPAFEIPEGLRIKEYLKREYRIIKYNELPAQGCFFVKDVTKQRTFSFMGELSDLKMQGGVLYDTHDYLISEILNVLSEYRVYVVRDKIKCISLYKGDAEVLPDIAFIKNVIQSYKNESEHLQSYSLDIMMTTKGAAIIEMHTFLSLGLYTTKWDESLLTGYIDGINYVIND